MAVAITRTDLSTEELRGAARRTTDTYQARRLLALALVVDGASRTAAARAAGMERQTQPLSDRPVNNGKSQPAARAPLFGK